MPPPSKSTGNNPVATSTPSIQSPSSSARLSPPPKLPPTQLLSTPLAQTYKHLHPALVLLTYLSRFSATVQDPVSSLTQLLFPLAILQAAFCGICLPPSSGEASASSAGSSGVSNSQSSRKKAPKQSSSTNGHSVLLAIRKKSIPTVLSHLLTLTLATPALATLLVLHGAPLTTHHAHTALLALHLSFLTTPPLFYTTGISSASWRSLVSLNAAIDEIRGAAMGAIFGAWVGAVPIPLDWDREWQKWPVTVVTGVYLGWAAGLLLGGTFFRGKRVKWA